MAGYRGRRLAEAVTMAYAVLRDKAAELWLTVQHSKGWYIGEASMSDWQTAYAAIDEYVAANSDDERPRP